MQPNAPIDCIVDQIVNEVCRELLGSAEVKEASGAGRPLQAVSRPYWSGGSEIAKAKPRLEYTNLRPNTTVEQLKRLCDKAGKDGAGAVCVLPWFVEIAKKQLAGSGAKVVTLIGLPGGEGRSQAKYAAVKQAVLAGADVIEVPAPMRELAAGEDEAVGRHLKESVNFVKGKADTRVLIDVDMVGPVDAKRLADLVRQTNMCGVSFYGKSSDSKTALFSALAGEGIEVKLLSGSQNHADGHGAGLAVLGIEV